MKYYKRVIEGLRDHLVNSTAIMTSVNPLYALLETKAFHMTDQVSINARYRATWLTYGGLGWILLEGRKLSRRFFDITEKTSEWIQLAHDGIYTFCISLPIGPPFYWWSGETDLRKIAVGTIASAGVGVLAGPVLGYGVDVYKDLVGLDECKRPSYPDVVKNLGSNTKRVIAAGLVAASIGLTAGVYSLTPDIEENNVQIENASNSPQDQAKELYSNDF